MNRAIEKEKQIINDVVEKAYDVLAFPPGGMPKWDVFMSLFYESAQLSLRVFPQDKEISLLTLVEYTKAQMGNHLQEEGYSESPVSNDIEVIGDIAWVRQHFIMNFSNGRKTHAMDLFLLVKKEDRWKIISVASDML
ncbi:hypothetical protein P0G10_06170 [Eubacteriales bacterium DFI.9.88]|nr:hypothetical protein [Eubacteriales bacterium DFI.9.88]